MTRALADLRDDDPITLFEASEIVLRGAVTVSTLRAEIRRGNLAVEKIGKNEGVAGSNPATPRPARLKTRTETPENRRLFRTRSEHGGKEMSDEKEECGNCQFWQRRSDHGGELGGGLCRRYPPFAPSGWIKYPADGITRALVLIEPSDKFLNDAWPSVHQQSWCGEFRSKDVPNA